MLGVCPWSTIGNPCTNKFNIAIKFSTIQIAKWVAPAENFRVESKFTLGWGVGTGVIERAEPLKGEFSPKISLAPIFSKFYDFWKIIDDYLEVSLNFDQLSENIKTMLL